MPTQYELDIEVTRGDVVESRHIVHAAVVDARDALAGSAGNATQPMHWRSCAKPFQILPLLASGGFDTLRWGDDQLALACGSHGGEPEHVEVAGGMLADIGLEEGDLACGPHEPLSARGAKVVRDNGSRPTRLHNNCSGKHAAMLARAQTAGWPHYGYERDGHQVQMDVLEVIARWSGVPALRIVRAVDGCGAVCFALPLEAMARSYARLAVAHQRGDELATRVVNAMRARPFLVGGTDRFDSVLIEETQGRMIAKVGAEGVHCVAVPEAGIGIALKVDDGAQRGQFPAVLRLLQLVGALPDRLPPRLEEFLRRPVRNTRGETVGQIRPAY